MIFFAAHGLSVLTMLYRNHVMTNVLSYQSLHLAEYRRIIYTGRAKFIGIFLTVHPIDDESRLLVYKRIATREIGKRERKKGIERKRGIKIWF